jgi:hypothetical protein
MSNKTLACMRGQRSVTPRYKTQRFCSSTNDKGAQGSFVANNRDLTPINVCHPDLIGGPCLTPPAAMDTRMRGYDRKWLRLDVAGRRCS